MKNPNTSVGSAFVRASFEPTDHLAIVLLNRRTGEVRQRLADASRIADTEFQALLKEKNDERFEVYISMNTLKASATGRTKQDIANIRHVFLDFDHQGPQALERLTSRQDLPAPHFVVTTSPGKYQVIWKVEGFTLDQAERLQQALARETGADIAATDATRVLRLPGFENHKYSQPHLVTAEQMENPTARPEDFPEFAPGREHLQLPTQQRAVSPGTLSQSERDWAFAKRALARGDSPATVAAVIASYRQFDKRNPQEYADRTVRKALSQPPASDRTSQMEIER